MRAIVIPVEGPVQPIELVNGLDGGLKQLQSLVEGDIEALPLPEFIDPRCEATAYINEEGKYKCARNPRATDFLVPGVGLFWGDYVAGPLVVCGFDPKTGENAALPSEVERRVRLIESEAV